MMNIFRKFIPGSGISSPTFPSLDEKADNRVEIFLFDVATQKWTESVPGTISIDKSRKPERTFIAIKTDSHPYNLIRKITRDFDLIQKDERTWILRASIQTKSSDYEERRLVACRFSTAASTDKFHDLIKQIQSTERTGFENLNFRLEIIRRIYERELREKKFALFTNFPCWDDLLNGKYYQNFYRRGDSFQCTAEVREFDYGMKKWGELILGTVKIENWEKTEQIVLTVRENPDVVRLEITSDVEITAIDDRTCMWRGYKKCEKEVRSLLIGCRFISPKVAKTFMESVIKVQQDAPSRCAFRDEYMSFLFKKEYKIILEQNQTALQSKFPGEYELTESENDPAVDSLPSTSKKNPLDIKSSEKLNEFSKTVSSISRSTEKDSRVENSELEILSEQKAEFLYFDTDAKKWKEAGKGLINISRDAEIPNIFIVMKLEREEILSKVTLDLQLMERDSKSFVWRSVKEKNKASWTMSRFEDPETAEEFRKTVQKIQDTYSSELPSDEFELEVLKKLYENESEENYLAFRADLPSHVDLPWLRGPDFSKLRINKEISETQFSKGSLFCSKAELYKFDINVKEWRRLTALPGFVSINKKRFQEFQKTLIHAVTDDFQGRIIVKCEIGTNLDLRMGNKTNWMWRGYTETEDGSLESFLISCQFPNAETARGFKKLVEDVQQHSPWRCSVRDEFLTGILKKESGRIVEENQVALDSYSDIQEPAKVEN